MFKDPNEWDLVTKMGYTYTEQDFGSFFYKMYDRMNWHDGQKACQADGTHMVVPESVEENRFISNLRPGQDCCSCGMNHTSNAYLENNVSL